MTVLEPSSSQRIAVTGANGFLGAHCVVALLKEGFSVVAIVRDPSNDEKTKFLKDEAAKIDASDRLTFAAGDLLKANSYDDAFEGCHGVLHTAAVVEITNVQDPENQIVRPSVEGTQNVLGAVQKHSSSITRLVHFSSVAAIQSLEKQDGHVFTEKDWNTWSTAATDPYGYAKTKSEQLVWDFSKKETNTETDVVVINPVIVLGPCLCKAHTKSSTVLLRQILYGNPMLNYNGSFVDVRDVAKASVQAFIKEEATGKRFLLCGTEPMNTMELNAITKRVHPWVKGGTAQYSPALLTIMIGMGKILPFLQGTGPFPNEFQVAMLERLISCDATQSKEVLGIQYTSMDDTCRDTVDSMKPFINIPNWGGNSNDDEAQSRL